MSEVLQAVVVGVLVALLFAILIWFVGGDIVEESGEYCFGGERISFAGWACIRGHAHVHEVSIREGAIVDRYETPFTCVGFRDALLRSCDGK